MLLAELDEFGSPVTMAMAGPRYFGFVNGGALPATITAHWLATAWDQNSAMRAMPPVAVELKNAAYRGLKDLFGFRSSLVGLFSLLALGLSAVGVHGVISCLIARRTNEVGLRLALGASPLAVYRLVIGGSLRLVFIGLGMGVIGSVVVAKALEAKLPLLALDAHDPSMLVAAVLAITVVSLVGTSVPAIRAAMVDPLIACSPSRLGTDRRSTPSSLIVWRPAR